MLDWYGLMLTITHYAHCLSKCNDLVKADPKICCLWTNCIVFACLCMLLSAFVHRLLDSWQVQCLFESHSPKMATLASFYKRFFHTPHTPVYEAEVEFPISLLFSYMSPINSLLGPHNSHCSWAIWECGLSVLFMTNHSWLGSCLIYYLENSERKI